jgi:hypothetical protein
MTPPGMPGSCAAKRRFSPHWLGKVRGRSKSGEVNEPVGPTAQVGHDEFDVRI